MVVLFTEGGGQTKDPNYGRMQDERRDVEI